MSEQRAPYQVKTSPTEIVELRLVGNPIAVEALAAWLQERLEAGQTRQYDSQKQPGKVLCYFVVKVG